MSKKYSQLPMNSPPPAPASSSPSSPQTSSHYFIPYKPLGSLNSYDYKKSPTMKKINRDLVCKKTISSTSAIQDVLGKIENKTTEKAKKEKTIKCSILSKWYS